MASTRQKLKGADDGSFVPKEIKFGALCIEQDDSHGSLRILIDYWKLNAITRHIQLLFFERKQFSVQDGNAKSKSKLDLKKEYYQIKYKKEDIKNSHGLPI